MALTRNLAIKYNKQTQYKQLTDKEIKEQVHLVEQVFELADLGKQGFLTSDDLKVAVLALFGHKPSKSEVSQIMSTFGSEQESENLVLNKAQFYEAMKPKFAAIDEDEEIRLAFTAFDSLCEGFLTLPAVKKAFKQTCPFLSDDKIERAFREVDRDGDGRISYKDFDFMMKFENYS